MAKSFGEKGVTEIAPLFVSHDRDLGDVFVVVDQEADIAPIALSLPAVKVFEDEQRANFTPALDCFQCGSLDLTDFSLAEIAADLGTDDRTGRVSDGKCYITSRDYFLMIGVGVVKLVIIDPMGLGLLLSFVSSGHSLETDHVTVDTISAG